LDSVQATLPSTISLGENDTRFNWFINGNKLPKISDKNYQTVLPSNTWKAGKNILLLKIDAPDKTDQDMGLRGNNELFYLDLDGEKLSLADTHWKMLPSLDRPHHLNNWMNSEGAIIYNAMLHPLIPYGIRGALWYQGEANVSRAFEYRKTFPLMIESWRKEWKDSFPFLFVQLADFGSNQNSNMGSNWAELRESQSRTLQVSGTGMSVTTDIGDPKDIHPKNKQEVGRRLAAIALNLVYGFSQTDNGPVYDSVAFFSNRADLYFKSVGRGLWANDKYGQLRGFEIAGANKIFYYAQAYIRGNHIEVNSDSVNHPIAVRYGWSDSPDDINLYNLDGFPASPFRTDNWPGLTDAVHFYNPPH
jgi:sialate O-acetylesterase